MQISYIGDVFDLATTLIPGLLEHWKPVAPEDTWDSRLEKFRLHLNRDTLPTAWVAHEQGRAMGMAALRTHDLPGREDLGPWLGGVFVAPGFRRRGVASALCQVVETRARELAFPRLYLFTLDQRSMYEHMGWQRYELSSWRGHSVDVMTKEL